MKYLDRLIFGLLFLSILGFSYFTTETENTNNPELKTENIAREEIKVKYIPILTFKPLADMRVSWYGKEFHGRATANGEIFDTQELTAAHKTLEFGTLLKVTNPHNKKSVIVRINDRGPFVRGRDLDLSQTAAESLGLVKHGVLKMKVEIVTKADSIQIFN